VLTDPSPDGYLVTTVRRAGDTLRPVALPGVALSVTAILHGE
jgi:hypothetical protein